MTVDHRITPEISIACLDMAGTTVADDGAVPAAFTTGIETAGVDPGGDEGRAALA